MTVGPPVVGVQGAARMLGISPQRLHVLRGREGFPAATELESGPVWYRHHIVEWAKSTGREVRGDA